MASSVLDIFAKCAIKAGQRRQDVLWKREETRLGFKREVWSPLHEMLTNHGSGEGGEKEKPAGAQPRGPPTLRALEEEEQRSRETESTPRKNDVTGLRPGEQWREIQDGTGPRVPDYKMLTPESFFRR